MSTQAQRRERRRRTAPGFPKDKPFESIEDVREYLSGDRVQCLLCGRMLKAIGYHLQKIHFMSGDDYKEKFGIPWTYGLVGEETSQKMSESIKSSVDVKVLRARINQAREFKLANGGGEYRPTQKAVLAQRSERIQAAMDGTATIDCIRCGKPIKAAKNVKAKRCDGCIASDSIMTDEAKARVKDWIADNRERFRRYNSAKQSLRHGHIDQAIAYERDYGSRLRALDGKRPNEDKP